MPKYFCVACGGPLRLMGVLGTITHYACRNCGLGHGVKVEAQEDEA